MTTACFRLYTKISLNNYYIKILNTTHYRDWTALMCPRGNQLIDFANPAGALMALFVFQGRKLDRCTRVIDTVTNVTRSN